MYTHFGDQGRSGCPVGRVSVKRIQTDRYIGEGGCSPPPRTHEHAWPTRILAFFGRYAPVLEPMLYTHVLPELQSPVGFMRSRACWVFGQFAKSVFASGKATQKEQFGQVFQKVMGCMEDADLPVRVQAALAINSIVESNCAPEAVQAMLPQLVDALFKLMK